MTIESFPLLFHNKTLTLEHDSSVTANSALIDISYLTWSFVFRSGLGILLDDPSRAERIPTRHSSSKSPQRGGITWRVTCRRPSQQAVGGQNTLLLKVLSLFLIISRLQPPFMAHSQSKTWTSNDALERQRFKRMSNLLYHFVPKSPFVPRNYQQWVDHRAAMKDMEREDMLQKIERRKIERPSPRAPKIRTSFIAEADKMHLFEDNRSAVLAMPSIWSSYFQDTPDRPYAPWPDRDELRYEGDDRAKTNVGRFLPLPRRPGNETVTWKAREQLMILSPLDSIGPLAFDGRPVNSPELGELQEHFEETMWLKPLMDDLLKEL